MSSKKITMTKKDLINSGKNLLEILEKEVELILILPDDRRLRIRPEYLAAAVTSSPTDLSYSDTWDKLDQLNIDKTGH